MKREQSTDAKSVLERARIENPKTPELWLDQIRIEMKPRGNREKAKSLMKTALKECPCSGILWAEFIFMQPKSEREKQLLKALKKCENDPHVALANAK